jgi:hypothetical protein
MSTPDESSFLRDADSMYGPETLHELEHEVRLDLDRIAASAPERAVPVGEWLVDPAEVERDEVALRSLLGAVEAMEGELPRPDDV